MQEIRRRGFMLAGPDDASPDHDPECLFDLIDLPEAGTVDWDALGFGCREPVYQEHAEGPAQEDEDEQDAGGPSGVTC